MSFYRQVFSFEHGGFRYGFTVSNEWLLPSLETFSDGAYMLTGVGLCFWRQDSRPVTVGERGVW